MQSIFGQKLHEKWLNFGTNHALTTQKGYFDCIWHLSFLFRKLVNLALDMLPVGASKFLQSGWQVQEELQERSAYFSSCRIELSPPKAPLAVQGWETLNMQKSDISNSCPLLEQIKLQQIRLCLPNFAWTIACCTKLLHSPEVLENRSNRCKFMKSKRRMHNFVCGAYLDPKSHRSDTQLESSWVVGL